MEHDTTPSVEHILERWKADQSVSSCFVRIQSIPARPAHHMPMPPEMAPSLAAALKAQGITALYSHQAEAWKIVRSGQNLVVVTGTASGKTFCYNLPVLDTAIRQPGARALYLFPTKALAQDQLKSLQQWTSALKSEDIQVGIYDGDTPATRRQYIRTQTRLLLTNPDMLHTGMLPHHTIWADFWKNLRYIVLDELHIYRGVFGSHVANLLRRVKRIAEFYGAHPQFLLTSATIANPGELASQLIESPVIVVDQDGSPSGARHLILYNPPITDPELRVKGKRVH